MEGTEEEVCEPEPPATEEAPAAQTPPAAPAAEPATDAAGLLQRAVTAEEQVTAQAAELRRYRVLEVAQSEAARLGLQFEPRALADAYTLNLFAAVQPDEGGALQGVEQALRDLAESRPYLLAPNRRRDRPPAPDIDALARGGAGNPLESAAAKQSAHRLLRGF